MVQIENTKALLNETKTQIIVPIVGRTEDEVIQQAEKAENSAGDIVEWRIDYYKEVEEIGTISELSYKVKEILSKPLLVTFRTLKEGGERELSSEMYKKIYSDIIENGSLDSIDIELFTEERIKIDLLKKAHQHKIEVVMSSHDFEATPKKEELISRLKKMDEEGADVCKIAVMPKDSKDVLTLLQATLEAKSIIQKPLITISMGEIGKISRTAGIKFGSAATFGAFMKSSAPGQIEAGELKNILEQLNS